MFKNTKIFVYTLLSIITIIGIVNIFFAQYTNIQIKVFPFLIFWVVLFIAVLIFTFKKKLLFIITLVSGIIYVVYIFTALIGVQFNQPFMFAKKIDEQYIFSFGRYKCEVIKQTWLTRQVVARKPTEHFSSNRSKVGIVLFAEIELIGETDNSFIVKINQPLPQIIDTLPKVKIFDK